MYSEIGTAGSARPQALYSRVPLHEDGSGVSSLTGQSGDKALSIAVNRIVEGLNKLLSDEVAQLRENPFVDTSEFANGKALYMLELNRLMRTGGAIEIGSETREQIISLRSRLVENGEALKIHLDASRAIAETIKRAIRDEESDGTYEYGAASGGSA